MHHEGNSTRSRRPPLDTATRVITPENIEFEYRLAGPFLRFGAFLIDRSIIVALLIGLAIVMGFLPPLRAFLLPVLFLAWFVLWWFYGGLFETFWNGTTPGKVAMGIRVMNQNGRPITALQAIVRNLFTYADLLPMLPVGYFFGTRDVAIPVPIGAAGLVAVVFTSRYLRVGDLICGTMVVVEQREWAPDVIHVETPDVVSLAAQFPASFRPSRSLARAVANYLDRRRILTAGRRAEMTQPLRDVMVRRYGLPPQTDGDLLMRALYYRIFIADRDRDEQYLELRVGAIGAPTASPPAPAAT